MLLRFSIYGFLKNQRYFEPFLILMFLDKGFSFFQIGLLVAFRELTIVTLEIPSGAIADIYGRRKSLILSFSAYIGSFLIFAVAETISLMLAAMFLFGIGEAFRSGTHKAMIFSWLKIQNQLSDRTRYYGYTRSWSKFGSAFSVLLAAGLVFTTNSYATIFYFATIPYLLNIINFMGYPSDLDNISSIKSPKILVRHVSETVTTIFKKPGLRRLLFESMSFEGTFHAVKDYIQPVLMAIAISGNTILIDSQELSGYQRASILVAAAYLLLHLLSGIASRNAHLFVDYSGGEDRATRLIWEIAFASFVIIALSAYLNIFWVLVASFILLHVIQNFWRPILISRFDFMSEESQSTTILSVESQSRHTATMCIAPMLGLAVDYFAQGDSINQFWPVGVVGSVISLGLILSAYRGVQNAVNK